MYNVCSECLWNCSLSLVSFPTRKPYCLLLILRAWLWKINELSMEYHRILFGFAAFCPYHIGQWTIHGLQMTEVAEASKFAGVFTTMVGYIVVAIGLVLLHSLLSLIRIQKWVFSFSVNGYLLLLSKSNDVYLSFLIVFSSTSSPDVHFVIALQPLGEVKSINEKLHTKPTSYLGSFVELG